MYCYYHSDRPSVAQCVICGKDLCSDCNIVKEGQSYCRDCLGTGETSVELGKLIIPALGCGAIGGVLSLAPGIGCLCCLWVILAGGLAVFILKRYYGIKGKITMGNAILTGGLAGFVASIISLLPVVFQRGELERAYQEMLTTPEVEEAFRELGITAADIGAFVVLAAVISVVLFTAFGALGGILSNEIAK